MKNRVLHIDSYARLTVKKLIEYAENNVFDSDAIKDIAEGKRTCAGDDPDHVCFLDYGYRVVYSIEFYDDKRFRHMSVSIDSQECVPNPEAIEMIMKEFGYTGTIKDCVIWVEENVPVLNVGKVSAVNIVQKIK